MLSFLSFCGSLQMCGDRVNGARPGKWETSVHEQQKPLEALVFLAAGRRYVCVCVWINDHASLQGLGRRNVMASPALWWWRLKGMLGWYRPTCQTRRGVVTLPTATGSGRHWEEHARASCFVPSRSCSPLAPRTRFPSGLRGWARPFGAVGERGARGQVLVLTGKLRSLRQNPNLKPKA